MSAWWSGAGVALLATSVVCWFGVRRAEAEARRVEASAGRLAAGAQRTAALQEAAAATRSRRTQTGEHLRLRRHR